MTKNTTDSETSQNRWARFRFTVVGQLLSCPPQKGELQKALEELSQKQWTHPITGEAMTLGISTIERWLYKARKENDPVAILRSKRREDAGKSRQLSAELKQILQKQYKNHPGWSYQLHCNNLEVIVKKTPGLGEAPSYSTVMRYLKAQGLRKQRRVRRHTAGAMMAAERLEQREVRSYEVDYVHALWHLDFHHGSRPLLLQDGTWQKPLLLSIMDDHSRLICHAQWYLNETAETLVHGFKQALQKRALPRSLMTDNGSAMMSAEFTRGLESLGILHEPTLPYSPHVNGKQEVLWGQVEGRLIAMLEGEETLSLELLNKATLAWIEFEYHRSVHSELAATPLERYLKSKQVGRPCPETDVLRQAFTLQVSRKQRKSDGTFSLEGKRFEVPNAYRHMDLLPIRYARWDLGHVLLVDPHTTKSLCALYPLDKSANASAMRRALVPPVTAETIRAVPDKEGGMAPLLQDLIDQHEATGLPLAYCPKGEKFSNCAYVKTYLLTFFLSLFI
jgi:transposase InsO family protein